ncbi:NAD-dependent epimerase/dehydratase family protein [Qingshengfaniella alkalisoli]|uniref:NAD(P)-dependent oxidoreductase n=1 Tax=Qingshengfaniella alkalisoli TaxID=2599296 RepID=A0A5B8ICZ4_9RHOB|nr:NAD(P)-dependent oxidoreductase [Qingshengfaniella alkalisoli]QDY71496.1 NAD(P)-dependent oxidoreductase [Qingshengfaniella alkalisoli]
MKRLLITGAAGGLGSVMRTKLAHLADTVRLSDVADMGTSASNEELVECDLSDEQAVNELVEGCDGIVHFGGVSIERPFRQIMAGNIHGVYNLYEAARAHGMPRIVFASSNHTIGFHTQDTHLQADCVTKPDSLYGVSKCFGESMASMYHSKFGQETAIVRIGSSFEKPTNHRMMATWFSYDDFTRLIERVFSVRKLGCPIIWGVSANDEHWWDNSQASFLGWVPKDNSEIFREEIEARNERPDADSSQSRWQGGHFCDEPIYKD